MKPEYVVANINKIIVPWEHVHVTEMIVKAFLWEFFCIFLYSFIYCVWMGRCSCAYHSVFVKVRKQSVEISFHQQVNSRDQNRKSVLVAKSLVCLAILPDFIQELVISYLFISSRFITLFKNS